MLRETLHVQIAQALGVETAGLVRLVLTLQPGQPPLIDATYRVWEAGRLAECVRQLELVGASAVVASPAGNPAQES